MATKVREINPNEINEVQKLGRRAFKGFESLWVSKPKSALVVEKDGIIVGSMLYKILDCGGKKVGYIDYMFIDRDYHGQGIGNILYKEGTEYLWSIGCDALTGVIKDDNVGSWALVKKNGFSRISILKAIQIFGFFGMFKQYFLTPHSIGIGMDYYVAYRGDELRDKENNVSEVLSFILTNIIIAAPILLKISNMLLFVLAYVFIMLGHILFGYVGTLFSKRRWKFRFTNGGALVCFLFNFVTVYPMVGNWYPTKYEKSSEFKKDMGVNSFMGWIFLIAISLLYFIFGKSNVLISYMAKIASSLLLYKCIPFYPFESFGGKRLINWNKPIFWGCTIISLAILYFI